MTVLVTALGHQLVSDIFYIAWHRLKLFFRLNTQTLKGSHKLFEHVYFSQTANFINATSDFPHKKNSHKNFSVIVKLSSMHSLTKKYTWFATLN